MARVFVTGASGFVGARVCPVLRQAGHEVVGLYRAAAPAEGVTGDLLAPETYEPHLAGVDLIVHLAAVTGKAPPAAYVSGNIAATQLLVAAAQRAGVPRLLFCSTIAVGFPEKRRYFYAESKTIAESVVAESGLAVTIVRPTLVGGVGSPVMSRLASLAGLPWVPAFGGGHAKVQPLHVEDLAAFVNDIVQMDRFRGETLELGGPDVLSLRELLGRLHRRGRGRPARFVSVPLGIVMPVLRMVEPLAYAAMPLTIGQLATFRFDGIAAPNDLWRRRKETLVPVERMIEDAVRA